MKAKPRVKNQTVLVRQTLHTTIIMPPTLKKLEGHTDLFVGPLVCWLCYLMPVISYKLCMLGF